MRSLDGLNLVQPINGGALLELLDKDAISGEAVKFIPWRDFDVALQLDEDLYEKVISLGRSPDRRLRQHLQRPQDAPELSNDILAMLSLLKDAQKDSEGLSPIRGEAGRSGRTFSPFFKHNSESNFII